MKNLILSIFVTASFISCSTLGTSKSKVGTQQISIVNSQWKLADKVKGKIPTLILENGKVSGNAGCNTYFANTNIDAVTGNFNIGNIGSTKMMCDNMATEQNFLNALSETNKYVVSGSNLELYKDKLLLLKFNKMQ